MVTERFDWGNVRRTKRFSVELSLEGFDRGNKTQKICRICRISRLKLCISPNKNLENVSILRKNNRLCLQNGYRLVYFMAVKREK